MAITHKYTLICDDVRQEVTGKLMLIGLYMGNITVPQIPFLLPALTFFHVFESDRPATLSFRVRLENLDTGQAMAEAMGGMNIIRPGTGIAPVRFSPIQFSAAGSYNLVMSIEGEPPIISHFDVIIQPQPQQQFMPPTGLGGRPGLV
jgi:hypothetical protein